MNYVDISKYKVDKPYQAVDVPRENRFYASLLMDDYAGAVSEYTAISQYVYAHIISDETDLYDDFLGIAMVEMTHLDLLGDIIKQLGGNPVFRSSQGNLWNSSLVPYSNSIRNRLRLAIRSEEKSIDQYKAHITRINDPNIKALLQRIILDEEIHIQVLKPHLDKFRNRHDTKRGDENQNEQDDEQIPINDNEQQDQYNSTINNNNNSYEYDDRSSRHDDRHYDRDDDDDDRYHSRRSSRRHHRYDDDY